MKLLRCISFFVFALGFSAMANASEVSDSVAVSAIGPIHDGHRSMAIDPVRDSLSMEQYKAYLDNIRKRRPTVALVLSGGGAKGAAHIGVLEYLDSLGVPVDVVLGTSMGGLIGGLFALGYAPSEMDSLIRTINWDMALTDKVSRDYRSYATNKYKEKYVLSFPFYYSKNDFFSQRAEDEQYAKGDKIHLGAGDDEAEPLVRENIKGSLPSGYAYGQNVNNIFNSLTAGYQDDMDFVNLPVPFVCVATEMVTAKAKIWYGGKIVTALRSTMSIPGVFAPVKVDGMVLVDGGMRNNYPTDLAREMGADIIIGVDLSSGTRGYRDLKNLGDIISQGIDMLGKDSYDNNVSIPDVTIKPYLPEYNMMSFDDKSIDVIISRGYEAAKKQAAALDSIKTLIGPERGKLANDKAYDLNMNPVRISGIEITGVTDKESSYLMRKLKLDVTRKLDRSDVEDAVATIFGTDAFDYVSYELEGAEEPFRLKIHCKRGPINQFGIGGRFDTEEMVSVLLNYGIGVHKLRGSAVDLTAKVGTNPYAKAHYYLRGTMGPTLNVTGSVKWMDRNQFRISSSDYTVAYLNFREELYLSGMRWRKYDMRAGVRSDFYKPNKVMANNVIGDYDKDVMSNAYLSVFADARADTFNDGYFPTRGFTMGLGYEWVFAGLRNKIEPFHAFSFDVKVAVPMGKVVTFLPSVYARYLLGDSPSLPYLNLIGGSMAGRYLDQQIPFVGINYASTTENFTTVFRGDLRFRLFKNNYITAIANYALSVEDFMDFQDVNETRGTIGAGIMYSYDSIVGPLNVDIHWSSKNDKVGFYIGLGFDF